MVAEALSERTGRPFTLRALRRPYSPNPMKIDNPAILSGRDEKTMLILFVEYHASFRQSASYLMDREDDMEVVSQAGSVAEGREKMAEGGIDAAVVDIPLPDEGAAAMVGELHDANPAIPVLVLTRAEDAVVRAEFLAAGASEVLSKECTFAQILAAVRRLRDEA